MRVYVDQLSCTGAGQCELLAPDIFVVGDDGLATVKDSSGALLPDGGAGEGVEVPAALEAQVRDAADVCPGACILLQG
jgi:ferredoxin